jgi:hypothetical protein
MVSTFGWLDGDSAQRSKMLEVVDLFKEEDTVDELGIGTIRDALANSLFPGTSVLHTRLRYVLFIPWLMQRAAQKTSAAEMSAEFRNLEYRLIPSLNAGDEHQGVFGNRARKTLKRLPSSAYWAALGIWNIRTGDFSADEYFRRQYDYRQLAKRTPIADDPEARELLPSTGLDRHLPRAPDGLLKKVDFVLTSAEEQYLSDLIATATKGSMLSWLIRHQPGNAADYVWEIDNLGQAPEHLQDLVDHARRFAVTIHGAALVYNLLVARKADQGERVIEYEDRLQQWRHELTDTGVLHAWDRNGWWATIRRQNPRLRPMTMRFVNQWLDLIGDDVNLVTNQQAHKLISTRERQIKGGRARLANQAALDRWSGRSGLTRHEFRWSVARGHLEDLYAARAAS